MGNCISCLPKDNNQVAPAKRPKSTSSSRETRTRFSFRFGFGRKRQNKAAVKKGSDLFVQLAIEKLQQYNRQRRPDSVLSIRSTSCSPCSISGSSCTDGFSSLDSMQSMRSTSSTPWSRSGSSCDDVFSYSLQSLISKVMTPQPVAVQKAAEQKTASSASLHSQNSLEDAIDEALNSSVHVDENSKEVGKPQERDPYGAQELLDELNQLDFTPLTPVMTKSMLDGPSGRRPKTRRGHGILNVAKEQAKKDEKTSRFSDEVLEELCNDIVSTFDAKPRQPVYDEAELRMMEEIEKQWG